MDNAMVTTGGRIETAETWYPLPPDGSVEEPATWVPLHRWRVRAGEDYEPPQREHLAKKGVHKDNEIKAFVRHGRWLVECPHCHSCQVASVTDKRFLCIECHNVLVNGDWFKVSWPTEKQRLQIEAVLLARPFIENRNWEYPETVKDLKAENREHGLPETA
jgi:hypothetical protein